MSSIPTWVDNQMPFGSRVETLKRAGATLGVYVFDGVSIERPTKAVERHDEIGKPSGFALVDGFVTGSGTVQIATSTTQVPRVGDYFIDTFDGSTAGAAEEYVITSVGQAFEKDGYRKVNVSIRLSPTPPSS